MSSSAEEHVLYQIANARMLEYPYAHIYVEDVFPADFYQALLENWPQQSSLLPIDETGRVPKNAYRERFVMPFNAGEIEKLNAERRPFWQSFASWLLTQRFMTAMIDKFEPYVKSRFGDDIYQCGFEADSLIVRDVTNFNIGPHTDGPHRLLSMLFYCPPDASLSHLGTSIYVPRDPAFVCPGGPHYSHAKFHKVKTMEYRPNSLFAFIKNDRSFHGVEPIGDPDVLRDILLYDVRVFAPGKKDHAAGANAGVGFLKRLLGGNRN
ncbi:MAG: methyltransferase FkbM family [Betaproteobacteria bacterium]|nr:methyltransferase FkbM family [Betaproteobacteria bacterium]